MKAVGATARFYLACGLIGGTYLALILALLIADVSYTTPAHLLDALRSPEIRFAIQLSLFSCFITTLLSLWVAIPLGYVMSRARFPGKAIVDTVLDVPIVLPPLVIGLSLLILMQTAPGKFVERHTRDSMGEILLFGIIPVLGSFLVWPLLRTIPVRGRLIARLATPVLIAVGLWAANPQLQWREHLQARFGTEITFQVPAVILAQFAVSCAFAVRTMRVTFDQISPRCEQVAQTLGCTPGQSFWLVALPEAWRGVVTAGALAWARALGEFGPILIFAGATRMRTEVLSTTVFLELNVGRLEAAISVSLLMVGLAVAVLILMRSVGLRATV